MRLNGCKRRASLDVENRIPLRLSVSGHTVDRVLMNPPFHDARRQNVSPDPRRRLAHVGTPGLLARWVGTAAWLLKPRGILTLIWRADGLADVLETLRPSFGDIAVLPVLPRETAPAIRVIVRAAKASGGPQLSYPAIALSDELGRQRSRRSYFTRRKNAENCGALVAPASPPKLCAALA
jgi:tRNA1(Val) A37 N6-methylase TrmN6